MIEDLELRSLFKSESEEHLHRLEGGLLHLETDPTNAQMLEEMFREAHSLKGAAGMLGVVELERLAHHFEDVLNAARQGKTPLSPGSIDQLCHQLDSMRQCVVQAVTAAGDGEGRRGDFEPGTPLASVAPEVSPPGVLAVEEAGSGANLPIHVAVYHETSEFNRATGPADADNSPTPAQVNLESSRETYRLDTIRVAPQKLDVLMTQAGELTVVKIRIARQLAHIEELVSLYESWNREILPGHRSAVANLGGREAANAALHPAAPEHYQERLEHLGKLVSTLHATALEDSAKLDSVTTALDQGIRSVRLLPLATIFHLFPRMVRDLAREQGKTVEFHIEGGEIPADKRVLEEMKDPLMHMIRNAIDHGIEAPEDRVHAGKPQVGHIQIHARLTPTHLLIEVADDGRGLDPHHIKRTALIRRVRREEELAEMTSEQIQSLIFAPGFSTSPMVTSVSGRGVGLDVVHDNVTRLKGTIQVESSPGHGCILRVSLPRALAAARMLVVMVDRRPYAIPIEYVSTTRLVSPEDVFSLGGLATIVVDGLPVPLIHLSTLLDLPSQPPLHPAQDSGLSGRCQAKPCLIISTGAERLALYVDALVDEQEVVVKAHSALLKRVRNVSGATILGTGEVCIVLNPLDLLQTMRRRPTAALSRPTPPTSQRQMAILLAEDSITTRAQEKRILESAGYEVVTAVNGLEALQKLSSRSFDAVVSDVQMPHMDGLTLTERIRREPKYNELPVILVTSLATEEDKRRGVEVGANAYIPKPTFNQGLLLDTLRRLL